MPSLVHEFYHNVELDNWFLDVVFSQNKQKHVGTMPSIT